MRRLLSLPLVLVLVTAACGDGPTGPDPAEFPGTYELQAYVGLDLPVLAVLPNGSSFVIESGEMVVNADGSAAFRITVQTAGGTQFLEDPATWTLTGSVVRFRFSGGVDGIGDWEDDSLAITVLGGVYRFSR
jgi:hypothetical protein